MAARQITIDYQGYKMYYLTLGYLIQPDGLPMPAFVSAEEKHILTPFMVMDRNEVFAMIIDVMFLRNIPYNRFIREGYVAYRDYIKGMGNLFVQSDLIESDFNKRINLRDPSENEPSDGGDELPELDTSVAERADRRGIIRSLNGDGVK
jgi:hypothetical protein